MSQGLASFKHRLRKPPLEHPRCHHIEHNGREKAHNGINQVMRLYVHRSPAQQQIKRKQAGKQTPAAPPCHNHQNGGHADMRTGECRRRTLAYLLRAFHQIIKESVFVSRTGQQLLIVVEVIADSREYSLRYVIFADSRKIELRPCHRHEDVYQVVDEESGDYHERHFLKKVETVEEIPQCRCAAIR